jgi:hypothetical protein
MRKFWLRAASLAFGFFLAVLYAGPAAAEKEAAESEKSKLDIRSYDHFDFDTTTGPYFGAAIFYTQDHNVVRNDPVMNDEGELVPSYSSNDSDVTTVEFRLVYGGENVELGVMIPYNITTGNDRAHITDSDGNTTFGGGGRNDVGDIRGYLKVIPLRRDLFDFGGGLELIFPAGSESNGMSSGNIGILPFTTGTIHIGPVDLNAHLGYNFINKKDSFNSPESLVYGGAIKLPVLDKLGLRIEIVGQEFTTGQNRSVAAVEPGLDYLIEAGTVDVLLSATAAFNVTGGMAGRSGNSNSTWGLNTISGLSRGEWGIGCAAGITWN